MSCARQQELLQGYLDSELDLAGTLEIERHLQDCPNCSREHRSQAALRAALRNSALNYRAPDRLRTSIRAALPKTARSESARRSFQWQWMALAAAALILAFTVWTSRRGPAVFPNDNEALAQDVVSSHIRSLLVNHATDVTSTDQHTVKPWFDGKLDFAPPVGNFASQGFPLLGGRLEYLDHRNVAALVYKRQQHLINLFVWPAGKNNSSGEVVSKRQGYNLIHWTSGEMNYWAVSDLNSEELLQFVHLVQGQ